VDEMAHTNAPGMRHDKRWQDIQEILDHGIDVYSTLNVQHIESLTDDVAKIIQASIQEKVPDSMIEIADTIELIDLPPDDLLKRLQDGKVYIPKQAHLATEHFFRKGNLIALRELALRATAEHVSAEVLMYRQGEGIKQIWPTKDTLLVCVGPDDNSLKLIRQAKRMAANLQADWIAVYVDRPTLQQSDEKRNLAIKNLRLAELLGAETNVLTGFDVVKEIIAFAHEKNVTQIILSKKIRPWWLSWFYRSLSDAMVRKSGEISVYIITTEPSFNEKPVRSRHSRDPKLEQSSWAYYAVSTATVLCATLVNVFLSRYMVMGGYLMIYFLRGCELAALILCKIYVTLVMGS
jgi:two-component system sensor histidine kinase KdpD